ncbi:DUF3558 domain-containing protein [Nocardia yunnanensis]|uniref:DUF3558 domain-containing protein n=1 Tax=Nocardia yunnanensis TaxID=2382165 RepID=A0A386ZIX9_9NOCA|nr:DUF3558 family protein [Nocardia yunnanensis]AYF77471.1 DUF3558 domain-containing protein [Nocardia yunnanensis]
MKRLAEKRSSTRVLILGFALGLLPLAAITACNSQRTETPETTRSTSVPSSFDPCKDIPADVLTANHLQPQPAHHQPDDLGGQEEYKGCDYKTQDDAAAEYGPGVFIAATNMTLDYFKSTYQPSRISKIDGRDVAAVPSQNNTHCILWVGITGGGIRFDTVTPKKDACEVLTDLVTAIFDLKRIGCAA